MPAPPEAAESGGRAGSRIVGRVVMRYELQGFAPIAAIGIQGRGYAGEPPQRPLPAGLASAHQPCVRPAARDALPVPASDRQNLLLVGAARTCSLLCGLSQINIARHSSRLLLTPAPDWDRLGPNKHHNR